MAFVNVRQVKRTAKFLILGSQDVGKTYAGLQLEAPIGAFDAADSLRAFRDLFDFGIEPVASLTDLVGKAEALLEDSEQLGGVETILIDGMHMVTREALEPDGVTPTAVWRRLEEGLCRLGARGKHIWVTWRGGRADVPEALWRDFDLVGLLELRDGARVLTILKSRFPRSLPVGDELHGFDVRTSFRAILDEAAHMQEENGTEAEMRAAREQIKAKLKVLTAKRRGPMATDEVERLWTVATDAQSSIEDLATALTRVRAVELAAAQDAAGPQRSGRARAPGTV